MQNVPSPLSTHVKMSELPQFVVYEWHQLVQSLGVAVSPGLQQLGDFVCVCHEVNGDRAIKVGNYRAHSAGTHIYSQDHIKVFVLKFRLE